MRPSPTVVTPRSYPHPRPIYPAAINPGDRWGLVSPATTAGSRQLAVNRRSTENRMPLSESVGLTSWLRLTARLTGVLARLGRATVASSRKGLLRRPFPKARIRTTSGQLPVVGGIDIWRSKGVAPMSYKMRPLNRSPKLPTRSIEVVPTTGTWTRGAAVNRGSTQETL